MQPTTSPNTLHQGCLGHLQHILELALHTADAASAEGNHKITLQAIREVTRIITLMTKMAPAAEPEAGSKPKPAQIPANTQTGATQNSELGTLSADLDALQEMFSSLAQLPAAKTNPGNGKPSFHEVGKKREMSGKNSPHGR